MINSLLPVTDDILIFPQPEAVVCPAAQRFVSVTGLCLRKLYRRAYIGHISTDHHSGIQKRGQHRSVTCSQVARELMQLSTKSSFRAKQMCTLAPLGAGCGLVRSHCRTPT